MHDYARVALRACGLQLPEQRAKPSPALPPRSSPDRGKVVVLDVRDDDEYSGGHIVNALNVPGEAGGGGGRVAVAGRWEILEMPP